MKKILLLACSFIALQSANAQYQLYLTGSSYTQNFSSMATLPAGWSVITNATPTTLGDTVNVSKYYKGKSNPWAKTFGEFREVASANNTTIFAGFDSVAQSNATDRALAVRQVGYTSTSFPKSDSGAAFALHIANPTGLTNFKLKFKLQSLDSTSPRTTIWSVDYGFGANPTSFTKATLMGDSTTGGNTYSNTLDSVDFGTALNGQTGPIWIRIVALKASSGTGNRTTTGIDDFNLTWTGTATGGASVNGVTAQAIEMTANATTNKAIVAFTAAKAGAYNVAIVDVTGRIVYTEKVNAVTGAQKIQLNNLNLTNGLYIIKMTGDNAAGTTKVVVE